MDDACVSIGTQCLVRQLSDVARSMQMHGHQMLSDVHHIGTSLR